MIIHKLSLTLLAASLAITTLNAQDKTCAPYFHVTSEECSTDAFPLKSTDTRVTISGTIAQVEIRQTYANTGATPIEATYVFPGSTRSAVHGMEMKIGEKIIRATIRKKKKARQIYEKAKSEHKTTSLLEQHRPNVFQMSVANILPGDEVEILLRYSEHLVPTNGQYTFVMPTVVGPRFSNSASHDKYWLANPYMEKGTSTPTTFEFNMDLRTGLPLKQVLCSSHNSALHYLGKQHATLNISSSTDPTCMNRDIIIRYRLAGNKIESGLLLHKDSEDENFFLLNIQPPARVTPADITPRDYLFVVDVSGSMNGFPLKTAAKLFEKLALGLRKNDSFNILLFAGGSRVYSSTPVQANKEKIAAAIAFMRTRSRRGGSGGTQLLDALRRAINMPETEKKSRSIIVITDGYINFEADAFDLIRNNRGNANVFCFGIGSSVNRHLVEGIARVGGGEPFVVTTPSEAADTARQFHEYISSPILTHVRIHTHGFSTDALQPAHIQDVFANRPVTVSGKWSGSPTGYITLTGITGGGEKYEHRIDVAKSAANGMHNPSLRTLWARERVRELSDYAKLSETDESIREVTSLGLTYGLLTPYTSFVAVDETPRTPGLP